MQHFGFCSEHHIPVNENLDICVLHVYMLRKNHCTGKQHDMFVSRHNKYDFKFTCNYLEMCQYILEQVHSQYFYGCNSISM